MFAHVTGWQCERTLGEVKCGMICANRLRGTTCASLRATYSLGGICSQNCNFKNPRGNGKVTAYAEASEVSISSGHEAEVS